jgi:hypothetical protein
MQHNATPAGSLPVPTKIDEELISRERRAARHAVGFLRKLLRFGRVRGDEITAPPATPEALTPIEDDAGQPVDVPLVRLGQGDYTREIFGEQL